MLGLCVTEVAWSRTPDPLPWRRHRRIALLMARLKPRSRSPRVAGAVNATRLHAASASDPVSRHLLSTR